MPDEPVYKPVCQCGCGEPVNYRGNKPQRFVLGHHSRMQQKKPYVIEDRGFSSPCWIWNKAKSSKGYGKIWISGTKQQYAHRVYYEQANGPIPAGLFIDHLCRQHSCVNPDHLEPVTNQENLRRGRSTKITVEMAQQIREASGTQRAIAARFGISHPTVCRIRRGEDWQDAGGPTGRTPRGKVTEEMVREIRNSALTCRALAREHGVSHTAVADIKAHRSWRNVS